MIYQLFVLFIFCMRCLYHNVNDSFVFATWTNLWLKIHYPMILDNLISESCIKIFSPIDLSSPCPIYFLHDVFIVYFRWFAGNHVWLWVISYDIICVLSVALITSMFIQWRQRRKPLKIGCFVALLLIWHLYVQVEFIPPLDVVDHHDSFVQDGSCFNVS